MPRRLIALESAASEAAVDDVDGISPAALRVQCARISASRSFERAPGIRQLFEHIVEATLSGSADQLKEYAIGVDVFGKGESFDPGLDTIVRVQARRLRQKIAEYYAQDGIDDVVRIDVPKGHYMLSARRQSASAGLQPRPPGDALELRGNLPASLSPLIGRSSDIIALSDLLQHNRLVTVCGGGGMGKTRLAIEIGRLEQQRFLDGAWLVGLDQLSRAGIVAETLLSALGLSVEGARDPTEALQRHLARRNMLLILDCAEHVLDSTARLVMAILSSAADVRILVTSREPLSLPAEYVYRINPLEVPPAYLASAAEIGSYGAVELFVRQARAVSHGYRLMERDAAVVGRLCRRLDGVPLAIELAAARLGGLNVHELDAAIDSHLAVLDLGLRSPTARHRTLQATLEWSYELLAPREQKLLYRLSVFAGGWTFEAAKAVATCSEVLDLHILDLLTSLVDKSLILTEASGTARRYWMLDTTKAFLQRKLEEAGSGEFERRHADLMIRLMHREWSEHEYTTYADMRARYEPELHNVRAAREWAFGPNGDIARGLELVAYSCQLMLDLGLINETRRWLARSYDLLTDTTPPGVVAHIGMTMAFRYGTGIAEAVDVGERSVAAAVQSQDASLQARAMLTLIQPMRFHAPQRAEQLVHDAMAALAPLGHTKAMALCLNARAFSATLRGEIATADGDFARALSIAEMFEDYFSSCWVRVLKFEHEFLAGRLGEAAVTAAEALAKAEGGSMRAFVAMAWNLRAQVALLTGRQSTAEIWALTALEKADDLFDRMVATTAMEVLAGTIAARDPETAARILGFCNATRQASQSLRRPSEKSVCAEAADLLAQAMAPAACDAAMAIGATLTLEAALSLVRGSVRDSRLLLD